jgi:hypothetical protein
MFSPLMRRGFGVTAAAALIALTAACGGGSANAAVCTDATKLINDYSTQVAAAAGDLEGINKATADLSTKFKELAGKADGDLSSALSDLSDVWAGFKIDASNPTAAAAQVPEMAKKAQEATVKLGTACSQ